MKKLKLNLEDLKVESFETTLVNNPKGTIQGYEEPTDFGENCPPATYQTHCNCPDTWGECETIGYGCTTPAGGCGGGGGTKPHQSTCANTCEIDCW